MRSWVSILLLTALLILLVPARAEAADPPRISAPVAVLMDWKTGTVLWQKNAHQRRDPASTTKVLTALITLERADLNALVKVSRRAAYTPGSSMYLKPNQVLSVYDLLQGLLMRSGNDAAVALAEHVAGSVEAFAKLMNQRAKELGAKNSHFRNPHGLTEAQHFTTAYDLALIAREAMKIPFFRETVAQKERALVLEELNQNVQFRNTNSLLWMFDGADGVKTGTTSAAGPCLIASATREEHKLIAVVLHAGNRWRDSAALLEWGYRHYRMPVLVHKGERLGRMQVHDGKELTVDLVAAGDLSTLMPRTAQEQPQIRLRAPERLMAPVKKGQEVARAEVLWGGQVRAEIPLLAAADVAEANLWEKFLQRVVPLLRWMLDHKLMT